MPALFDGIRYHGLERCADAVYGAPSMKCIFEVLLDEAKTEHVGYINADMIFVLTCKYEFRPSLPGWTIFFFLNRTPSTFDTFSRSSALGQRRVV